MRGQQILALQIEPREPCRLMRPDQFRSRLFRERQVEGEMARARVVAFARFDQPLLRVLPHGVEQSVTLAFGFQRPPAISRPDA